MTIRNLPWVHLKNSSKFHLLLGGIAGHGQSTGRACNFKASKSKDFYPSQISSQHRQANLGPLTERLKKEHPDHER
jgi:hypothetical protein